MYPGLRYAVKNKICMQKFFGNCLFWYKIRFAVENKNKQTLERFQYCLEKFLLSPSKKMLVIQFSYMEIV